MESFNNYVVTRLEDRENSDGSIVEFYNIEFPSGQELQTTVSAKFKEDLKLLGIIKEDSTPEDQQFMLEGYLIRAAQEFVQQGLDKKKQENGKFNDGGLDDEF